MNGVPLPHRHGYPARVIVPGYFGEKHVKWLTRIELAPADAKGFYETQGWGPDFIVPTRSRIDVPFDNATFSLGQLTGSIELKGVAFGGDRGISRVEVSDDNGETWDEAEITYSGGDLAWSLWSYKWKPDGPDDYTLVVRATDGEGDVQEFEEERGWFSGTSGLHKIAVHVTG
jgi:DMSO/TMAO reductase YedYZ molybdopterin-dependent catalytic subunit